MTTNSCLSSNAYLTYIGILLSLRKNEVKYFVRSDCLSYLLTNKYPPIKQVMKSIDDGIIELADKQIILLCNNDKPHEWIINTSNMQADIENRENSNKFYTIVDEAAIRKILLSNEQYYIRSVSLVKFYVYVLSTLFKKKNKYMGVGFTSATDMSNNYGMNMKTILSYLKQLEELKLIYIYHAKDSIKFDTGEIREISHTYGKYEDKEKVIQLGKAHEEEYSSKIKASHKKIQKDKKDATRAISQKYKHFVTCLDEGKDNPYSYEECEEIYIGMIKYNDKYEFRKDRIKDLSVFSEFDFYNTE